jgi:hypothetical protein
VVVDEGSSTRAMSSRLRRLAPRTHVTPQRRVPACALLPDSPARILYSNIANHSSTHLNQVVARRLKKTESGGKESFRALLGLVGMRHGRLKQRSLDLAMCLGPLLPSRA